MTPPAEHPTNDDALEALALLIRASYTGSVGSGPALPPFRVHLPGATPDAEPAASDVQPADDRPSNDAPLVDALVTLRRWAEDLPVLHSWHKQ